MNSEAVEAAVATVANVSAKAGAGTMLLGWLTLNDFALVVGLLITAAGVGVNWYYKRKADAREHELHAKRMGRDGP